MVRFLIIYRNVCPNGQNTSETTRQMASLSSFLMWLNISYAKFNLSELASSLCSLQYVTYGAALRVERIAGLLVCSFASVALHCSFA